MEEVRIPVDDLYRPDLAGEDLHLVRCPTLLIVGGRDQSGLRLNEGALAKLTCDKQLVVVGA